MPELVDVQCLLFSTRRATAGYFLYICELHVSRELGLIRNNTKRAWTLSLLSHPFNFQEIAAFQVEKEDTKIDLHTWKFYSRF